MADAGFEIAAIVQARMGSTRLPGKVLMDLGGQTVLARVIRRLGRATRISGVAIATTTMSGDDAIERECEHLRVRCFRGSEDDVLDRYYRAAKEFRGAAIVRVTADCPLIDPEIVDRTIEVFVREGADYANNTNPRTFPRGLDAEVFTFDALERAWSEARRPYEREHVTPYLYEHTELFRLASLQNPVNHSRHRWTLDTEEDLELIRQLYSRLDNRDDFGWEDALAVVEREPELAEINSNILQKALR